MRESSIWLKHQCSHFHKHRLQVHKNCRWRDVWRLWLVPHSIYIHVRVVGRDRSASWQEGSKSECFSSFQGQLKVNWFLGKSTERHDPCASLKDRNQLEFQTFNTSLSRLLEPCLELNNRKMLQYQLHQQEFCLRFERDRSLHTQIQQEQSQNLCNCQIHFNRFLHKILIPSQSF